jgi:hypothetical protein
MNVRYATISGNVQQFLNQTSSKVLSKASGAFKYLTTKIETTRNCDDSEKSVIFKSHTQPEKETGNLTQIIKESNEKTTSNFETENADSTTPKNETNIIKKAKINILSYRTSELDNEIKHPNEEKYNNNKEVNDTKSSTFQEPSTCNNLTVNPAKDQDDSRQDHSNKNIEDKTDNPVVATNDTNYKYGSVNYYAVLHHEYSGDYWDHHRFLVQQREKQLSNPIDISNTNKPQSNCKKSVVQTKTKKSKTPNTNVHRKTVTSQFFNKQSVFEYTKRVQEGFITSNMSFMKKRETVLPMIEITAAVPTQSNNTTTIVNEADDWTTVGSKGVEHKFEEVFAIKSDKYLPKQLPPGPVNTDILEQETKHTFPLMIKINRLKHQKNY